MPQWLILMSMSIALKGLGVKADQVMVPWAAVLSWASQPWKEVGEAMVVDRRPIEVLGG